MNVSIVKNEAGFEGVSVSVENIIYKFPRNSFTIDTTYHYDKRERIYSLRKIVVAKWPKDFPDKAKNRVTNFIF